MHTQNLPINSTSTSILAGYIRLCAIHIIMYDSLDNRKYISCVDYSKAFDATDHDILCKKCISWIEQHYFFDLGIIYIIANSMLYRVILDQTWLICGVPQGSILGPLFS